MGGGADEDDLYAWSTSAFAGRHGNTSTHCAERLALFFEDPPSLAIATEASSHPTGVLALEFQPWYWAGGGLGNIAECPIQTCIAGAGIKRDSLTFASLCIVPECTARDLGAEDFVDIVGNASVHADDVALGKEYTTLVKRIAEVNRFLGTGWICGDFVVPWNPWPLGFVFIALVSCFAMGLIVAWFRRCVRRSRFTESPPPDDSTIDPEKMRLLSCSDEENNDEDVDSAKSQMRIETDKLAWRAFDVCENTNELFAEKNRKTAILDGLRVGSICWIIVGHVMAITGSVAGYANPRELVPPSGYLASIAGQLVLSSRFAVDTFLIISGFLTFHALNRRLPLGNRAENVLCRYLIALPKLFLARAARVLPLYLVALLFYTQVAPHVGGGPFWYQWIALLKPCHEYCWTNFLFVNNFVPFGTPTTATCFYHAWYLAVDMQLFLLSAALVFWYQANPLHGKRATASLWVLAMAIRTYLAMIRHWSVNTFDGAAVARYDIEGYAKPHIRAQSYLTGLFVAMVLPDLGIGPRCAFSWKHRTVEALSLSGLLLVSLLTYGGANSRRPCQYHEWPNKDECGSEWSDIANWIYISSSGTIWCLSIGTLMLLFLGRPQGVSLVSSVLSWKLWAPLSRLSFAVYLIHPIIIFMWELGSTEKEVFRTSTFGMNVLAVCVASYLAALVAVITIEMPATNMLKCLTTPSRARGVDR